jgi:heat shock protein HslJ
MKKVFYACMAFALLGGSCKSQKPLAAYSGLEGEWDVIELNGQVFAPEEKKPFLMFNLTDNRVSGNAGCNQISGSMEREDARTNKLKFSEVVSTRKACIDMRTEDAFLKALHQVASFEADGSQAAKAIVFYGADKQKLFVISPGQHRNTYK